jgi:ribonucleoside-triphosphate reductase
MPRQKCEVYSRVCGYLRPVQQWNDAKQQEFADRKAYKITNDKLCQKKTKTKSCQ